MFNDYLNHSNQCANYYNVIRKEEINIQQNETNRFKQKWIEISSAQSANSLPNLSLINNPNSYKSIYSNVVKSSLGSNLEDAHQVQQTTKFQYQPQLTFKSINCKQISNQSSHLPAQSISYYSQESNEQNKVKQNNVKFNLTDPNIDSKHNQIPKDAHYYDVY
jgi:hypothetical protein